MATVGDIAGGLAEVEDGDSAWALMEECERPADGST